MEHFSMATVQRQEDGSLLILPDGMDTPLKKQCLIPGGMTLTGGDRVLLLKYAGCRLVLARYPQSS